MPKYHNKKRTRAVLAASFAGTLCIAGSGFSQTVTVDPTGTASDTLFTTLQDAVVSFATGGVNHGIASPDIINVRSDHGAVIGSVNAIATDSTGGAATPVTLDEDLTIQGVDGAGADALAVFAGLPIANASQNLRNDAFPAFAWRQAIDLTIRNIAFIPAAPSSGDAISSFMVLKAPATEGVNPNVNIEDCVFTSNDGNDMPITTTGRPEDDANLNEPGVITLHVIQPTGGAAGIWAFSRGERGDFNVNLTNTVFASLTPLSGTNPRTEVFKGWMSGDPTDLINFHFNVNEGCVFANIDGSVAQIGWGGMIHMNGTETNPIVVRSFQNPNPPAVIWLYYDPAWSQPVAGEFDHVHFYECAPPIISEGGAVGDGSRAFINSVTNTVFANSTGDAISLRAGTDLDTVSGLATADLTIDNTVFHNVGAGTAPSGVYAYVSSSRNVNVTNSYFTDSDANMTGLYSAGATGVWEVSDSTLSLTGATALGAATGGTGTINLAPSVTNEEVTYLNMDDPFSPDFFAVDDSSAVADWTIY